MTNPLVSVIIPTYNRVDFLIEAISSCLNQTYSNVELLIVDDGSHDNTYTSIKYILKSFNNCRYLFQHNRGVSSARNLGINHAQGEYIGFLDSDDLWDKRKLEHQMTFLLSQAEYQVCYTNEIWIRKGIRVNSKNKHQKHSGNIYRYCLPLCIISPSSILMHKDVIDRIGLFDKTLLACEDYDYWLRLTSQYAIHYLEEKLITKRGGHLDQLSNKYPIMDSFRITALIKMIENIKLANLDYKRTLKMIIEKCKIVRNGCYKRGKENEGTHYNILIKKYSQTLFQQEKEDNYLEKPSFDKGV